MDLLLDVNVQTVEGAACGGERACGVGPRQIITVAYQAVTAAVLSGARGRCLRRPLWRPCARDEHNLRQRDCHSAFGLTLAVYAK